MSWMQQDKVPVKLPGSTWPPVYETTSQSVTLQCERSYSVLQNYYIYNSDG